MGRKARGISFNRSQLTTAGHTSIPTRHLRPTQIWIRIHAVLQPTQLHRSKEHCSSFILIYASQPCDACRPSYVALSYFPSNVKNDVPRRAKRCELYNAACMHPPCSMRSIESTDPASLIITGLARVLCVSIRKDLRNGIGMERVFAVTHPSSDDRHCRG